MSTNNFKADEKLKILEDNWDNVKNKVILPLWNGKFKSMYECIKMDYDDFESLAAIELTKAIKTFNSEKSNLYTFATNVIKRKAITEMRDCTQRDVRKALYVSENVDAMDKSIIENLPYSEKQELSELSELRVGNFVNSLNNNQLRILILSILGFEAGDMAGMLNMSNQTMHSIVRSLKDTDLTRVLYRRKF